MSNEELHIDGDFTLNIPHFEADFTENEQPKMQADFKIQTGGSTSFANITGSPYDNEALSDALNQKADTSTVGTLSETVENNYTELDGKITDESDARTQADADLQSNIDDVADDLSIETDNRQTADADLQDNIDTVDGKIDTHIADKTNPHEVTKAQIGLGNVDNTSDLNKPISTATQTALNGKQNTISDLSTIRTNASNGQSAYNTIQNYGDIVTYDASYFATSVQGQKADTALQPNDNISELNNDAGYITNASLPTVNNSTITFQKNNVTVGDINLNQANNETINFNIPTTASDVNALPDTTTINDLTTTAQQNAIDSGANTSNIGQIATNTSNISSLSTTVTNNYNTLDGRITSEVSALNTIIGTETTNRQNADNNLQSQIDAIVSSSDVFDIVGTYAELQAYDISTVPVNDIIKVLVDSTHSNAATYYRCVEVSNVKSWSYIGSEGAYYTKSESDSLFVEQTTTVNGKALSNNITLTASDVGALPSSIVIGNGTLTIQNNSVDVDTFDANATSNKTINIITPTKTSDLTNDSGFIDSSALSGLATQTDLTNGLATKQDTISDLSTIRSNAANGQSAYTTIGGYGDIVTHNTSEFATSAQGDLADASIQPNDNITLLNNNAGFISGIDSTDVITALGYTPYNSTNPNGYTSNVGTVTSVNNTQPDANGNVTISVTGGANTDLSNLTATGEAHFQEPLVSGTNIKTINNNSILGSGNINTKEIFIAEYGVTTYQEVLEAYNNRKNIICFYALDTNSVYVLHLSNFASSYGYFLFCGVHFNEYSQKYTYLRSNDAWDNIGTWVNEVTSNKVTSISSSSTNTQYPSAKLLYDQLALKQNASTAVTHTANTAVGSSTTPVYINSSGVATSTGLSIASSRFDGQWVASFSSHSWTAKGSYTISLSGYLPSDRTSYSYYIYVVAGAARGSSNGSYRVGTVASPATNTTTVGNYSIGGYMTSNSTGWYGSAIIPVAPSGSLYSELTVAVSNAYCYLIGYRRIGTNT